MTIVMEFQSFKKGFQVKSTTIPNWNLGSMHIYYLASSLDGPSLNAIVIFIFAYTTRVLITQCFVGIYNRQHFYSFNALLGVIFYSCFNKLMQFSVVVYFTRERLKLSF